MQQTILVDYALHRYYLFIPFFIRKNDVQHFFFDERKSYWDVNFQQQQFLNVTFSLFRLKNEEISSPLHQSELFHSVVSLILKNEIFKNWKVAPRWSKYVFSNKIHLFGINTARSSITACSTKLFNRLRSFYFMPLTS